LVYKGIFVETKGNSNDSNVMAVAVIILK